MRRGQALLRGVPASYTPEEKQAEIAAQAATIKEYDISEAKNVVGFIYVRSRRHYVAVYIRVHRRQIVYYDPLNPTPKEAKLDPGCDDVSCAVRSS